jgi:cholesterol transport system auxiliary component
VPSLSDTSVIWRVGDSAAPKAYATYRWASSPTDLVHQRIADRLSRQGPVLNERVSLQTPQLQVFLAQFEQVFAADGQSSEGRILLQAVLVNGRAVLGQKRIAVQAPAPTQDAAGGVAALRQASNEAADQLAQWLAASLKPAPGAGG